MPKSNADSVRLWAKHFAPISSSNRLLIPHEWSDFYTMLLLNPTRFDWAKEFIASKVWEFLVQQFESSGYIDFSLPANCPVDAPPVCQSSVQIEELEEDSREETGEQTSFSTQPTK
jgi:hypothetical protein